MDITRLTFFLVVLLGCSTSPKSNFNYEEMQDLIIASLVYPCEHIYPGELYHNFYNEGASYPEQVVYQSFDEPLNYKITEKKIDFLVDRRDSQLPSALSEIIINELNLPLTKDSTSNRNILFISEPHYIASNKLSFTLTIKTPGMQPKLQYWVYFVEKTKNNKYQIAALYDWQKDRLLKVEKLNESNPAVP